MAPMTAAQGDVGHEPGREIVLALNSGSSSLKFGLYDVDRSSFTALVTGEVDAVDEQGDPFDRIGRVLAEANAPEPTAVGHRVVHGGPHLRRHCRIDASVISQLESAVAFAPVHIPPSLRLLKAAQARYPNLPQVACFDTVFHATMPIIAQVLPLPRVLRIEGIRHYGFHGLSCESIVHQLASRLPPRLIIAHLGNGSSVTAVRNGHSVDTSMGLTPSGGVIMGSRSGDLDPGVLLYLLREKRLDADGLEALIDHQSGLLGISGLSGDMRRLHEAAPTDRDARLAIDMFCYSVRKEIGAMISVLKGIDMLVFTGGIGENDLIVRTAICGGLDWAGVVPNGEPQRPSGCRIEVLTSGEDEQIARHVRAILDPGGS
jgi:acetate kinase